MRAARRGRNETYRDDEGEIAVTGGQLDGVRVADPHDLIPLVRSDSPFVALTRDWDRRSPPHFGVKALSAWQLELESLHQ